MPCWKTWRKVFAEYVGPHKMASVGLEAEGTCMDPIFPQD